MTSGVLLVSGVYRCGTPAGAGAGKGGRQIEGASLFVLKDKSGVWSLIGSAAPQITRATWPDQLQARPDQGCSEFMIEFVTRPG